MHDQRIACAEAIQVMQRFATGDEIIFGQDFEPINGGRVIQNFFLVFDAQADAKTEEGPRHRGVIRN